MSCFDNHTTEGGKSRPCPISGGREAVGNDRRTRSAGQQHSPEPFLVCDPADQADGVVEGVSLVPKSEGIFPFARQDKPLQHTRELEACAIEVVKDGAERRLNFVVWSLMFHRTVYAIGHEK